MKPKYLVVHCSASNWGDVCVIRQWHISRGWNDVGYHKIIVSGFATYRAWATGKMDCKPGFVQQGRPDDKVGAQAVGFNNKSLGICLVGNFDSYPVPKAQWDSVVDVCARLCHRHSIPVKNVIGHRETYAMLGKKKAKTCPGSQFDIAKLRQQVAGRIEGGA